MPGLSPSFCFRLGVDLELLLRLLGGRPSPRALSPFPFACSPPFTMDRGPSSSPPTSTTRSPSDLSPESDSCPDFRRSSVFRRLADISSFGVDERIGLRAEIGDRGRWFKSLGPSRGSLLWRGEYFELREEMMWWWLMVTCSLGSLRSCASVGPPWPGDLASHPSHHQGRQACPAARAGQSAVGWRWGAGLGGQPG